MRKKPWHKACGSVAHTAILIGWHVVVVFSGGAVAIVAITAAVIDALVVEGGAGKGLGVVAQAAILVGGGWHVTLRLTGRANTVMARYACFISELLGSMRKNRFRPGASANMTGFTIVTICG